MQSKLRGGFLSNGSLHSMIDNEIEEAVKEKKREQVIAKFLFHYIVRPINQRSKNNFLFTKSSSSGSEGEEDSGIFTKIKEKAADVFD